MRSELIIMEARVKPMRGIAEVRRLPPKMSGERSSPLSINRFEKITLKKEAARSSCPRHVQCKSLTTTDLATATALSYCNAYVRRISS